MKAPHSGGPIGPNVFNIDQTPGVHEGALKQKPQVSEEALTEDQKEDAKLKKKSPANLLYPTSKEF